MSARAVLFVPQHQGGGTGEFYRLLAVAEALHARDATVGIHFLMPQACPLRVRLPFAYTESDLPDSERARFHAREIARLRPTVVVFDQTCRGSLLGHCHRLGVPVVCATFEPGTSGKTFRVDWLWRLDEHWHQQYRLGEPPFDRRQRLLAAISSTRRLHFDVCHAEPVPADEAAVPKVPYVLFVPGGGGYRIDGRSVSAVFAEAAGRVAAREGIAVQVITSGAAVGDDAGREPHGEPGVERIPGLQQGALIARMRGAAVVVTGGGGGTLPQALSVGAACVAVPLGGSDQQDRVRHLAERGWCVAAEPSAESLAAATTALLADDGQRRQIRERLAVLGLRNGLPLMVDALLARLGRAGR